MVIPSSESGEWELDGNFRLWAYSPSHSQMLFRSLAGHDGVNTDLHFTGVLGMRVSKSYERPILRQVDPDAAADLGIDVPDGSVAVLFSNTIGDYVICASVRVLTNRLQRFEVPIPLPLTGVLEDEQL